MGTSTRPSSRMDTDFARERKYPIKGNHENTTLAA